MESRFDEPSESLAEGVSRREALRKFGFGLAGVLLALLGLCRDAEAAPPGRRTGRGGGPPRAGSGSTKCHRASDCYGPGIAYASCCNGVCVTSTGPYDTACCSCVCHGAGFGQDK